MKRLHHAILLFCLSVQSRAFGDDELVSLTLNLTLLKDGQAIYGPIDTASVFDADITFQDCSGHRGTYVATLRGCCDVELSTRLQLPGGTELLEARPIQLREGDEQRLGLVSGDDSQYTIVMRLDEIRRRPRRDGVRITPAELPAGDLAIVKTLLADRYPSAYAGGLKLNHSMSDGQGNWMVSTCSALFRNLVAK